MNIKNPDDDINVATVDQTGTVRVYGHLNTEGYRHFIRSEQFACWGAGKLWADEYEQSQRDNRPVGRR